VSEVISRPKFKYSQSKLVVLLEYLETDPGALSRQDPLNAIESIGKRRLPLDSQAERKFYVDLAIEKGFASSEYGASNFYEDEREPVFGWTVGYLITLQGREYLDRKRSERLHVRWWEQLLNNVPTIVVSVISALLVGWVLNYLGPVETNAGDQTESNP
jgi:hypothetical protein